MALWRQYTLSFALAGAALLVRWALDPLVGDLEPVLTLFIVLMPLAVLVRPGPFVAAAGAGLLGAFYFFMPPRRQFEIDSDVVWVELAFFSLAAVATALTVWLAERGKLQAHRGGRAEALADMSLLRDVGAACAVPGADHDTCLGLILDAAMALTGARMGLFQLLDGSGGLMIAAQSGFGEEFLRFFRRIEPADAVASGATVGRGSRVVIPDLKKSALPLAPGPQTALGVLLRAGVRAVQSTPLIASNGTVLGIISTHFGVPHEPREDQLRLLDLLARQAADFVMGARVEQQLREHRDGLEREVAERTRQATAAIQSAALAQRMAAVGTMASGLAHDMKNVLIPLSVRLDGVMAASGLSGEARKDLTVMVALLDHLREMARNLSLFARDPDQEGIEGTTDFAAWYRRVKGLIEASAESAGNFGENVRVRWDIPDNLPPIAIAPHRLTQAVLNLVQNARDAVASVHGHDVDPGCGCINVAARRIEGAQSLEITVSDNGCGMNEEALRRCIEPFFTTKVRPSVAGLGGSGLGLALVNKIVQGAGGRLKIESRPAHGTKVSVLLPITERKTFAPTELIGSACVNVEDKRTRALVSLTLRALRYEVVDGDPDEDTVSTLWVTDAARAEPKRAVAFLGLRSGQRVIVIGGNGEWRAVGAVVCDAPVTMATIRRLVGERPAS